jgi:hypothetical protein
MRFIALARATALVLGILAASAVALQSQQVVWTEWNTAATGTVSGNMGAVGVVYAGPYAFAQVNNVGVNYWNFPIYDVPNRPERSDIIALNVAGSHSITFSAPVMNPFFAFVSVGRPGLSVSYFFGAPFEVISVGPGYWGNGPLVRDGQTMIGTEGHGVIQFSGTFTEIAWSTAPNENWHGLTVGATLTQPVQVPEPLGAVLVITGLAGLAALRRRRWMEV